MTQPPFTTDRPNTPLAELTEAYDITPESFTRVVNEVTRRGRALPRIAALRGGGFNDVIGRGGVSKYVINPMLPSYPGRTFLGAALGGLIAHMASGSATPENRKAITAAGLLAGGAVGYGSAYKKRQNVLKAIQILKQYNVLRPDRIAYTRDIVFGDRNEQNPT